MTRSKGGSRGKTPRGLHLRGVCRDCRQVKMVKVVLWRAGERLPSGYCGPCREAAHNECQKRGL